MTKEIVKLKEIKLPNLLMDTNELETYDISVTRYSDNIPALVLTQEDEIIKTISVNLSPYGFIPQPNQIAIDRKICQSHLYKVIKEAIAIDSQPITINIPTSHGNYDYQTELLTIYGLDDTYCQIIASLT